MKTKITILFFIFILSVSSGQIYYPFNSFHDFRTKLDSVANITDETQRNNSLGTFWDTLKAHHKIPFTLGDSVVFLYRGNVSSVVWAGDFNGWDPTKGGFTGTKIGLSNIWSCYKSFPTKARLDYKIVLGSNWIMDPDNIFSQYSGVGTTNSELRMPEWVYPEVTINKPGITRGIFSNNFTINSTNLGYTVYYRVYTPYDYETLSNLPVIYVTDGQEYSDERMGSMITVLDNLIYEKKIKPIVAVFIDPRNLSVSEDTNRRMSEYVGNKKFADFVADELVPNIDSRYKTNKSSDARAILGTSLGGINSAYFGAYRNDKFHLIGIHSPAFWYYQQIYNMYSNAAKLPLKIFMSTGTIFDTQDYALQMKSILDSKGYPLMYIEVPEGHSWGNWRSLLDEPLIYFFKDEISTGMIKEKEVPSEIKFGNYPNPFNPATKIWFTLTKNSAVTLDVFNSIGEKVDTLISDKEMNAGFHTVDFDALNFSSGVYLCRLTSRDFRLSRKILFIK